MSEQSHPSTTKRAAGPVLSGADLDATSSEDETASRPILVHDLEPLPSGLEFSDPHSGDLNVRIEPRYEWGSAPADADAVMSVLLTLTPEGAPLVAGRDGPIAHVVLALDLSASMNHPDKYPVLTQALRDMVHDLKKSEHEVLLSVVAFAKGSETLFRAVPASMLSERDVLDAVDKCPLRFGRYTDIRGGLSRAGRIAYESKREDPVVPVRIYLMTDGKPQDLEGARKLTRERLAKFPVDVDALAFGDDSDVDVLKGLVSGGRGGTVKHVRTETLGDAFGRIADVAQNVVANRAVLRIELARGVLGGAAYRFRPARHAYGNNAFVEGRAFETDLGTLESGRAYSMLFQVRLPQTSAADTDIGEVFLRLPGHGGPREFRCTLAVPRHRDAAPIGVDPAVIEAREVLESFDQVDPQLLLKSLRARRKIYVSERRDPYLLEVVDKAIAEIETAGNLAALSNGERAALSAHTATAGSREAAAEPPRVFVLMRASEAGASLHERWLANHLEARGEGGQVESLLGLKGVLVGSRHRIDSLYAVGGEGAVFLTRDVRDPDAGFKVAKIALLPVHRPFELDGRSIRKQRDALRLEARYLEGSASRFLPRHEGYFEFQNPLLDPARGDAFGEPEPLLLMEKLPGRDLDRWLARMHRSGVPPEQMRRALDRVAVVLLQALVDLYDRGFLYADLRPANLRMMGRPDRVVRLLDAGSLVSVNDRSGRFPHVPSYLPPALFQDKLDGRTIVPTAQTQAVMAGRTLYEVATGSIPRPGQQIDVKSLAGSNVSPAVVEVVEGLCAGDFEHVRHALRFLEKRALRRVSGGNDPARVAQTAQPAPAPQPLEFVPATRPQRVHVEPAAPAPTRVAAPPAPMPPSSRSRPDPAKRGFFNWLAAMFGRR